MKRYIFTFIILCTCVCQMSKAQTSTFPLPSSTAYNMLQAIPEHSVAHYTGSLNITIPFYEIKLGNKTIPIGLNYVGSNGIRVTEEASWVGLGWSLNAGGVVTCTMQGQPDEPGLKRPIPQGAISIDLDGTANDVNTISSILRGDINAEPDIFNYSYPGGGGKFFYKEDGSVMLKTTSNVEITNFTAGSDWCFEIVDEYGNKYRYEKREYASNTQIYPDEHYATAWYLTSIRDHNSNNLIEYEYDPYYTAYNKAYYEYTNIGDKTPTRNTMSTYLKSHRLRRIKFAEGSIEFVPSAEDRKDVSSGQKYLDQIIVKDNDSRIVKQFNFIYTYNDNIPVNTTSYGPDTRTLRLRLAEIQQVAANEQTVSHVLQYNSFSLLPSRDSYNYDHWGYANGSNNSRPDPKRTIEWTNVQGEKQTLEVGTANRDPHSTNYSYVQAGLLKKIIYPTKGFLEIQYEPHFSNKKTESVLTNSSYYMDCYDDYEEASTAYINIQGPDGFMSQVYFDNIFWKEAMDPIYYGPSVSLTNTNDPSKVYHMIGEVANFRKGWNMPCTTNCSSMPIGYPSSPLSVPPGRYKVFFKSTPQHHFGSSIRWTNKTEREVTEIYGGVRVKKIVMSDGQSGSSIERTYAYTTPDNRSSAVLISKPRYESPTVVNLGYAVVATGVKLYCEPYNPIFSDSRYHVGYSTVTEIESSGSYSNGETVYKFTTSDVFNDLTDGYIIKNRPELTTIIHINGSTESRTALPPAKIDSRENLRGLLTHKIVYKIENGVKKKLQSLRNTYYYQAPLVTLLPPYDDEPDNYEEVKSVKGIHAIRLNDYTCYDYYQTGKLLSNTYDTLFQDNGHIASVITNQYTSKYYIPTKVTTTLDSGKKIEKQLYYPFSSEGDLTLLGRNVLYRPVKELSFMLSGGLQTKTQEITHKYKSFSGSGYYVYDTEMRGRENNDIAYLHYDKWGNIVSLKDKEDMPIVYLWSYNGQYPIAEIKNATWSQITGIISEATLNAISDKTEPSTSDLQMINSLRYNTGLKDAMVTTYSYKPLVGISAVTDPSGVTTSYEYDNLGRLKRTKDTNGKIVEAYEYNYANE